MAKRPWLFGAPETKGFKSVFRVSVEGFDEMLDEIERLGKDGLVAARDALASAAHEIKAKAIPLVPEDPETVGLLVDTLRVYTNRTHNLKPGVKIFAGVVAGGAALRKRLGKREYSAWAIVQHEDLTLKHTKGQAKFLEKPGLAVSPSVPDRILDKLDKLGGGVAR